MQVPSTGQVQEINDAINEALRLEKSAQEGVDAGRITFREADKRLKRAAKLKQKAIHLADKYYGIDKEPATGRLDHEPQYDPHSHDCGDTKISGRNQGHVTIGPDGFVFNGKASASWLASTKVHEILGHLPQIDGIGWGGGNADEQEIEAYQQEHENRDTDGLTDDEAQEIRRRMQRHFRKLPPAKKPRWVRRYSWIKLCAAYIYRNPETGNTLYCTNNCGDSTREYQKVGAGNFPCNETLWCSLA